MEKIKGFIQTVEKDNKFLAKDLNECLKLNVGLTFTFLEEEEEEEKKRDNVKTNLDFWRTI